MQIQNELAKYLTERDILDLKTLKRRPSEMLSINKIDRNLTLFSGEVPVLKFRAEKRVLEKVFDQTESGIDNLEDIIEALKDEQKKLESETTELTSQKESFISINPEKSLYDMVRFYRILNDSYPDEKQLKSMIESLLEEYEQILSNQVNRTINTAFRNTDVYLTWDFMDVYFATSMRNRWEFEECADFISALSKNSNLKNSWNFLRIFNPTQSKCYNRIDKGLLEQLMLKRVNCTVYMAQEIDTMGKDSELAATLAQGKPVIAYIPSKVDFTLLLNHPADFHWQRFLSHMSSEIIYETDFDDYLQKYKLARSHVYNAVSFLHSKLSVHLRNRIISFSKLTEAFDEKLRNEYKEEYHDFVRVLAAAQEFHYDKRMKTLRDYHPLALQVDLATGVANGVLIVRSVDKCAELLKSILENNMKFVIDRYTYPGESEKSETLVLRETITDCVYRVQTEYERLSNSFWNFYSLPKKE